MSNKRINTLDEFAKVPWKEKIAYCVGECCGQAWIYYLVLTLSSYFYTDVMHISASLIGTVVIISRVLDAFSDLLIGTLIDRTKSKLGKARAWAIYSSFPFAFAMFLIYCVPSSWTHASQVAYIIITYNLATTIAFTAENIPWGSLTNTITRDRVERSQLSAMRMAGSPLGGALGVGIALPLIAKLGGTQAAWIKSMAILGFVGFALNIICCFIIKERVQTEASPEMNKRDIPSVLHNKYFWMCIIIIGLYNAFITAFNTFLPYYSTYVLGDTMLTTKLNYAQTIALSLSSLATVWLCKKIDSTIIVRIGMVIAIIGQVIGLVDPASLNIQIVSGIMRSIGWGLLAALIHSMVGDAIEYGEWRTGHKAPGTTYAAQGLGNKMGVLIGGGIATLLMGIAGYDGAAAVQSEAALAVIKGVYLWLPLIFAVINLIVMCFWKLNRKNVTVLLNNLENKNYHPKAMYLDK